jgi:hypothetical protein
MAVGVECGNEQHGDCIQSACGRGTRQQFAQRNEARVLAIAFAWMDSRLQHQNGNAPIAQLLRCRCAAAGSDQCPQRAVFAGLPEFERTHGLGPRRGQGGAEPLYLIDASRLSESGLFGESQQYRLERRSGHGCLFKAERSI